MKFSELNVGDVFRFKKATVMWEITAKAADRVAKIEAGTRERTLSYEHPYWSKEVETVRVTLKANGQEVICFGNWGETSNCECVFGNENWDFVYVDGASDDGSGGWPEVVAHLTDYAKRKGQVLVQLEEC